MVIELEPGEMLANFNNKTNTTPKQTTLNRLDKYKVQ